MKINLKKIQIENTNELKTNSSLEHQRAKKVLKYAKSLNRPVKFIPQGNSTEWLKEQKKISIKNINNLK